MGVGLPGGTRATPGTQTVVCTALPAGRLQAEPDPAFKLPV